MAVAITHERFGKAILENLDCLAETANNLSLPKVFTDYYLGFKNLIFLHEKLEFITEKETQLLLEYLEDLQDFERSNFKNVESDLEKLGKELPEDLCKATSDKSKSE